MRHRPVRVPDLEEPDLTHVDAGEGVRHERVEAVVVDLDVEDASAAGGHITVWTPCCGVPVMSRRPRRVEDRADDVEGGVRLGPAATT